ncbi:hypothetical protein HJC23_003939 [Cyclotella cryptica]|uniref:Uncharacterized protein n=1 Tax=Cyclotella cryptica TaxID=29204 RepID=A0ABD3PUK5_9STRA
MLNVYLVTFFLLPPHSAIFVLDDVWFWFAKQIRKESSIMSVKVELEEESGIDSKATIIDR